MFTKILKESLNFYHVYLWHFMGEITCLVEYTDKVMPILRLNLSPVPDFDGAEGLIRLDCVLLSDSFKQNLHEMLCPIY